MSDLSPRQTNILKAVIDEYIETAEPVGSIPLEKKYDMGVSPATIRNEMASLVTIGYLRQPHTSAGRVPTPKAMKFYINQLMEEKDVSLTEEVRAKEQFKDGSSFAKAIDYATEALARQTGCLAIAILEGERPWSHGYANIFNSPEFYDYQVSQSLLSLLDEGSLLRELFFERLTGASPIEVLFGEELNWDYFEPVGVVATRFRLGGRHGAIGVFGPYRLNYGSVIPMVRYFGGLLRDLDYEGAKA